MSRFKRFFHIIVSSYASLAAAMAYALISVPLALHYLPKGEFGLWAVMTQAISYVTLLELGMTGSVARHLIDHKDQPQDGTYGSVIQTGTLVLGVQGTAIFLVGFALSPWFARLLAIPADLEPAFILLLRWQSGIVALDFVARILNQIIFAHQRNDLMNYLSIVGFGINLCVLWAAFAKGVGLYSIIWASGVSIVLGVILQFAVCWTYHLFPPSGAWGTPSWKWFKELFHYGKDVFLVTLGSQLTNASQTIIVTRTLGLDLAAAWVICTKMFLSVGELIWRVFNYAEPMFSEMVARHETDRLRARFRDIATVTASISGLAAVVLSVCNGPFVTVWTAGRISWSPWNDVLLGVWLIIRSIVRCHNGLTFITKEIGSLRFIVFAEGILFVTLALLLSRFGGIPVILGASILCAVCVTGNYGTRRTARYFEYSLREVAFGWFANLGRMLAFLIPLAVLTWWGSRMLPFKGQLGLDLIVLGVVGALLWLRLGIPGDLQMEVLQRLPSSYRPLVSRLFYWR